MLIDLFSNYLRSRSASIGRKQPAPCRVSRIERLEDRQLLTVDAMLVKDISPGTGNSDPSYCVDVNGTAFFAATTREYGTELWKTDGTEAGTVQVRNIFPGASSSDPFSLTNVNGILYFSAADDTNGQELWKSDGTAAGTVQVKDIAVGPDSSNPINLTEVDGILYFSAEDAAGGRELWKSDGTEEGTVRVNDILIGSSSSYPYNMTNVNGTLYFSANSNGIDQDLWKSDGTESGTVRVTEFLPGEQPALVRYLANVNGTVFFGAGDATGNKLWKSDGSVAGTVPVQDAGDSEFAMFPLYLTAINETLYFSAFSNSGGLELWKSDGTDAGTVQVKDILPGAENSLPNNLTNVNGTLYFSADSSGTGDELWKSDGTTAGTLQLKDFAEGESDNHFLQSLTNINGVLYFEVSDIGHDNVLWTTDGTPAGTVPVDAIALHGGSDPQTLSAIGDHAFFRAESAATGRELWILKLTNQQPVIHLNVLAIPEGGRVVLTGSNLDASDPDNTSAGLIYSATEVNHGRFELNSAPGIPITSFSQAQIIAGDVAFVHDGGEVAPSYSMTVSDGTTNSAASLASVNFNNVNDAPVATSLETFSVSEKTLAVGVVTATDPDLPAQPLLFSLSGGADAALFLINPASGVLTFRSQPDYEHPADQDSDNQYNLQVGINDGNGQVTSQSLVIAVTNVVELPQITLNSLPATFPSGRERVRIDAAAMFSAGDGVVDYSNAHLTVSVLQNHDRRDRLRITSTSVDETQITVRRQQISINNHVVATFRGGKGRQPDLVIDFNSMTTAADIQRVMRAITFETHGRQVPQSPRTLQMVLTNGTGPSSNAGTRVIGIAAQ